MKKHWVILMQLGVCLTILLGVLTILYTNEKAFRKFAMDDVENISKLSSSIIYAEINNSMTKPIFVGQTMANDLFLKNWLLEEPEKGADEAGSELIRRYLASYSERYGYDSVSVISAQSNIYYYQDGINKRVSTQDEHDVWYYDFVQGDHSYKLNVDVDEAGNNELTVFVDSKVIGNDGAVMGVVGVGIRMRHLQKLLQKYEADYDLKILLIDSNGLVQVDSVDENIETHNFFDSEQMAELKNRVLSNKTALELVWYPQGETSTCMTTQYIEDLDWYIVVEKNTEPIQAMLNRQINQDLLLIALVIVVVLVIISYTISVYNRMLLKLASVDDVTTLPNGRMFQEIYKRNMKRPACRTGVLFIFDIDFFKNLNDEYGHLFGNEILYEVAEAVRNVLGSRGLVARWGGDEFVGVIYGSDEDMVKILDQLMEAVCKVHSPTVNVSISMGVTNLSASGGFDARLHEADLALYSSKRNGKKQITYYQH